MILPQGYLHRVDCRRRRMMKMRRHFGLTDGAAILFSPRLPRRSRQRHVLFQLHRRGRLSSSGLVLLLQTFIQTNRHLILIGSSLLHMCILLLLRSRPGPAALYLLALQDFIDSIIRPVHTVIVPLVILHRFGLHG